MAHRRHAAWFGFAALLLAGAGLAAQARVASAPAGSGSCLILPFENRSGDATLDWIGESFVVGLGDGLHAGPITVLSHQESSQALQQFGLPTDADLSHATMLRVAEAAGAHWLVSGWFDYDGAQLQAHAWVLDLPAEHMISLAPEQGQLSDLETVEGRLGWALQHQLDPDSPAPAPVPPLALPAYESYVRAQLATSPEAQVKELEVAAHLAPHDTRVVFALGQAMLAAHQNLQALQWLQQVPAGASEAPQAEFSSGLAAYRLGRFDKAEQIFAALQARFPIPAVTDNLALARARLKNPAAPAAGKPLQTEFSPDSYRQLANAVAQFDAVKQAPRPPAQQASFTLSEAQRLQAEGGWDAAARDYETVIASSAASAAQLGAAHVGMAAVWLQRGNPSRAGGEVAAALAADPGNAAALALQAKLPHPPHD